MGDLSALVGCSRLKINFLLVTFVLFCKFRKKLEYFNVSLVEMA